MRRAQATLTEYGAKAGWFSSHRWLAGNTAVPYYYGFDEQLQKTIEFLKAMHEGGARDLIEGTIEKIRGKPTKGPTLN